MANTEQPAQTGQAYMNTGWTQRPEGRFCIMWLGSGAQRQALFKVAFLSRGKKTHVKKFKSILLKVSS